MAVPTGAFIRLLSLSLHHLGGDEWRIQTGWSRWSGSTMGREKIQTEHELWQVIKSLTLLLWQEHYDKSSWQEIRIQVWLCWFGSGHAALNNWSSSLQIPTGSVHVRVPHQPKAEFYEHECPSSNAIYNVRVLSLPVQLLVQHRG